MHARHHVLSVVSVLSLPLLFAASPAHAQAPGEITAQPVVMVPESACVACGCNRGETVMSRRWAVGLSLGSMSLAPDGLPEDKTAFAIGELALRFRATLHLELELSVGGGRERTADDHEGDLQVSSAVIAARWRFRPEHTWNWFVMAGVGGASVTRHDATDQERSDATQPVATLGIGLEWRFRHFALQAEARAVGMGNKDHKDPPMAQSAETNLPAEMTVTSTPSSVDEKRSGGSFSVGLSYYF
jgi:opacity protein-like surface antigen